MDSCLRGRGVYHPLNSKSQKPVQRRHEPIKLIMVQPMSGLFKLGHFYIVAEMFDAAIALGVGGPTVRAIKHQRGASYRAP